MKTSAGSDGKIRKAALEGEACELGCRHWYFCAAEDALGAARAKKGHGGAVEGQVRRMWGLGYAVSARAAVGTQLNSGAADSWGALRRMLQRSVLSKHMQRQSGHLTARRG